MPNSSGVSFKSATVLANRVLGQRKTLSGQTSDTIFGLAMGKMEYASMVARQQKMHPAVAQIAHTIEHDYHFNVLSLPPVAV